jgi:hypothetical protein
LVNYKEFCFAGGVLSSPMFDSNSFDFQLNSNLIHALQNGRYSEAQRMLSLLQQRDSFPCNLVDVIVAEPLGYNDIDSILQPFPTIKILRRDYNNCDYREIFQDIFKEFVTLTFNFGTESYLFHCISNRQMNRIIHLLCHSEDGNLALENGEGGLFSLDPEKIRRLYRTNNIDLMVITACDSQDVGMAFVDAGVSHVICCRKGQVISECVATAFSEKFYQELIQKSTIFDAFTKAQNFIRHSFDVDMGCKNFILLPRDQNPDYHKRKVIFEKFKSNETPKNKLLCGLSTIPKIPYDFVGRQAEACSIDLQFP